jgi:hypothetical protein|uniref:Uncharacterized protein n=1 Tax=Caudovirales sp. ctSxd6 TaxID=2826774 RepID=A0A8S5ND96_9CAUD|nr:MAG TPA: hypothetical protein [Caudovirales sp. ctSxd6]
MATVVEKANPANQASLKVDENGNLLVVLKGGGGGGGPAPDLSSYYKKAEVDTLVGARAKASDVSAIQAQVTQLAQANQVIAGIAWYDRHNSQDGGGTGASLATKAPVVTVEGSITFAAQTTVTVTKAGWYRVSLSIEKADVAQTGFYLNNAVTKFTKHLAGDSAQALMGKNGHCSFLAYFTANTAHRISLNTPTTQKGQNAVLQIEYVGT